jgi:hypothetical protein
MCVWVSCFYVVDNCILFSYCLFCNFLSNGHLASVVQVPVCVETCVMSWLQITTYVTDATVLRDRVWVRLDSRNLVPGDIVKVRSDWLLPCDLLLIQGSCICNESALTGEAMPVQKYMAPNKPELYDPEGNGARHTLFSGTTVLQAGTQSGCEVLAFVTATGSPLPLEFKSRKEWGARMER